VICGGFLFPILSILRWSAFLEKKG
jgi:hypothetical protein